jgi:hypothetical protein
LDVSTKSTEHFCEKENADRKMPREMRWGVVVFRWDSLRRSRKLSSFAMGSRFRHDTPPYPLRARAGLPGNASRSIRGTSKSSPCKLELKSIVFICFSLNLSRLIVESTIDYRDTAFSQLRVRTFKIDGSKSC